jgi:signal peptide peptidase SppA
MSESAKAVADGTMTVAAARTALGLDARPYWAIREDLMPMLARAIFAGAELPEAAAAEQLHAAARADVGGDVAIVPIRGVITPRPSWMGGTDLQSFGRRLHDAVTDEDVSTIVLNIDSPGGSTDLVPETAAAIRAAREAKAVIAVANTMAASAAYWLASQAGELVITPSGEVGSIGVFSLHEEFSKMDEAVGITTTIIRSVPHKFEGNPYEPLSEDAAEHIQAAVNDFHQMFVADVAKGRGVKAPDVRSNFGEGRMVLAKKAVAAGMADRVATLDDVLRKLAGGRSRRNSGRGAETTPVTNRARETRALQLARPRHL